MGTLLDYAPRQSFAVRVHGKRWLKVTQAHKGPTTPVGWRALSWTPNIDEAEKWFTRVGAERFIAIMLCPCEVVPVERPSEMTPEHA